MWLPHFLNSLAFSILLHCHSITLIRRCSTGVIILVNSITLYLIFPSPIQSTGCSQINSKMHSTFIQKSFCFRCCYIICSLDFFRLPMTKTIAQPLPSVLSKTFPWAVQLLHTAHWCYLPHSKQTFISFNDVDYLVRFVYDIVSRTN